MRGLVLLALSILIFRHCPHAIVARAVTETCLWQELALACLSQELAGRDDSGSATSAEKSSHKGLKVNIANGSAVTNIMIMIRIISITNRMRVMIMTSAEATTTAS